MTEAGVTAWLPGAEVLSLLPRKIILSVLTGLSYSTGALHRSQARQRLLCVLKLADSVPSPRDEESELSCKLTEGPSPQFLYNLHCTYGKVLLHFCQGDGLLGEPDGGGLLRCSQFAFGDLLSFACLVWALKAQAQAFPLPKSFP